MPPTVNTKLNICSNASSKRILSYILTFFLVLLIIYAIVYILKVENQAPNLNRMNESFFQDEKNNKIVGYFMDGCRFCTEFHPIFDKVTKSYTSTEDFNKKWSVTTSNNVAEAKKQYNITGYPSVVIIKNDKVVEVKTGKMEESQFKDLLNKYI